MLALSLLLAAAPQLAPAPDLPARARKHVATLEGVTGAGLVGLFDARSGEFVPERLAQDVAGLTEVSTLPIDFVGRNEARSSLAGSPRLREDTGQGARIELANGGGSLYKLRARRAGALVFSLLRVDSGGYPRLLIERAAVAGVLDPFLDRVGIASDGAALLVATTFAAGGDLFEVEFSTGAVHARTDQLAAIDFGGNGLWLGQGWGFGIGPQGVFRFLRRPGAQAAAVPVTGQSPAIWRSEAALSPLGRCAVAIAGSGPDQWIPFVFGSSGPCRPAATAGATISSAGYLPEVSFGPFLAVLDDGVTAAWRIELPGAPGSSGFRDVVIGRTDLAAAPVVASGDLVILDTLDEIGRVIPSPVGEIMFAVGEANIPEEGGLESADVFAASVNAAGALSIRNASGTSGLLAPPFTTAVPLWTPARFAFVTDRVALIHDDDTKQLISFDVVAGTWSVVLPDVRKVTWIETSDAAGAWCAVVERDDGPRNWQVIAAASPQSPVVIVDSGSQVAEYLTPTASRAAAANPGALPGAVAYVRREAGVEHLDVVLLDSTQRVRWSQVPGSFAPPLSFLGPRTLAFSRQAGLAGSEQRLWSFRGMPSDRVMAALPRPSRILR